ncbi:MAG: insulinase family protein [Bacteroidaceae bacterium]|nr:insulinase family protein [Bacteroidaceae bacterium]
MKIKNLFFLSLLALTATTSVAQTPEEMEAMQRQIMMRRLPADDSVRIGRMDNGLTYYIRHNEEPKGQAFFYIAQKVGSIQEEESQRGLAHFLEHMCFNGTTHFPDSSLTEYLEGIGVKFGAQLNAYTGVEETVYNIDNVPAREGAIDSCLLILHDWSHDLTLSGKEIDKERGVIHGEWRMRNTGFTRILVRNLERLMPGRFGRRFPIGLMSVVDECPYDTLRAYYHKWYRPDLQGIVVVGDIDVDKIEGKIYDLFEDIKLEQPVAPREYFSVPDNNEAIVVSDKDPEVTTQVVMISMKHEVTPDSLRNTLGAFVEDLMKEVSMGVLNQRLQELSLKPECSFNGASVEDGDFLLSSKVTGALNIQVAPKEGRVEEAVKDVMAEIYRAQQYGITSGEAQRMALDIIADMEQRYNNRDKQKSIGLAHKYYRSFLDNAPMPSLEQEFPLTQQMLSNLPAEAYGAYLEEIITRTDTNLVVLALNPDKEGLQQPTEQQLLGAIHAAQSLPLEAWVDNVKTGPLVTELKKPGEIEKEQEGPCGSKLLTLSNGIRVILKPTDFKDDEILMSAWSKGGMGRYGDDERINLNAFDDVMSLSKLGGFTSVELNKALAGRNVSLGFSADLRTEGLSGRCSMKDIATFFELIYLHFQPREKDMDAFGAYKEQQREVLRNKALNPTASISDSLQSTIFGHHPRLQPLTEAEVDQIDYDRILAMYADRFADASDFTFLFIGNIDEPLLRMHIKQYLGTLPTVKRDDTPVDAHVNFVKGQHDNFYEKKMQTPQSFAVCIWSGQTEMTPRNEVLVEALSTCLSEIYLKKIREELGAAYSTQAAGSITRGSDDQPYYLIQAVFPLKPEMTDTCVQIAQDVFEDIARNGVAEESLTKVKEYLLKTYQQNQRENGWLMSRIQTIAFRGIDPAENYESVVKAITVDDIKSLAASVLKDNNRVRVVMRPDAASLAAESKE